MTTSLTGVWLGIRLKPLNRRAAVFQIFEFRCAQKEHFVRTRPQPKCRVLRLPSIYRHPSIYSGAIPLQNPIPH